MLWAGTASDSSQDYTFLYDGDMLLAECDSSGQNIVHAYIWGATGLNSRINNPTSLTPMVLGYAFDPVGNVVDRHPYGNTTTPVESAQLFDAFGQVLYRSDITSPPDGNAASDPIGYKGQYGCYTDPEIAAPYSLVYCHNRYYSTALGRWLSRDPIGAEGGMNVYSYLRQQPPHVRRP